MKKLLILACLFSFPAFTLAGEQTAVPSLFGVFLGMTYEEILKIKPSLSTDAASAFDTTISSLNENIGGVKFDIFFTYNYENNRCLSILARFPSDEFEAVSKAMAEKYGKGKVERSTLITNVGVMHEQVEVSWSFPRSDETTLSISRYENSVDKGTIFMISKEGRKHFEQHRNEKIQTIKKGL